MTINERFAELLKFKNISIKDAAEILDKSEGYVRKLLIPNQSFGIEPVKSILNGIKDISIEWLITGEGNMLKNDPRNDPRNDPSTQEKEQKKGFILDGNLCQNREASHVKEPKTYNATEPECPPMSLYKLHTDYFNSERQSIPLYEIDASAGLATLFRADTQQVPLDHISVPNSPRCDGAIYVRGDSMYPILKAGDIICYKTILSLDNIFYGDIHLLDYEVEGDQYLTIKYIQKSELGSDYLCLVSQNEHHAARDIHKSCIRAIALVKLSIRYNTLA